LADKGGVYSNLTVRHLGFNFQRAGNIKSKFKPGGKNEKQGVTGKYHRIIRAGMGKEMRKENRGSFEAEGCSI
jgi:hypothetical protein